MEKEKEQPVEGSVNTEISKEGNGSASSLENTSKQIAIKVVDQVIKIKFVLLFCYIYKFFNLSHWSCRMGWKSTSKLILARH